VEIKGFSSLFAALLFGSFFAIGIVMKPLSGSAYDTFGLRRTSLVIALVSGAALASLPVVEEPVPIALATILVAPILGSGTISQSYLVESLTEDTRGAGLGVIRTGALTMGALTPSVFGAAAEAGFFDEVFFTLAVLAGLMILLALRIPADK
jgi:MFS family permease